MILVRKNSKYIEYRGHDTDSWFQVRRTCNHVEHRRCDTFVYQVLRTFNMLTKSKISEARFQVRRTCNHVECQRHDTFVFPNFEEICKHVEQRSCDT